MPNDITILAPKEPTLQQRKIVRECAMYRIPLSSIARIAGLDIKALETYCQAELELGLAAHQQKVGAGLFHIATSWMDTNDKPSRNALEALFILAKTQMGWSWGSTKAERIDVDVQSLKTEDLRNQLEEIRAKRASARIEDRTGAVEKRVPGESDGILH